MSSPMTETDFVRLESLFAEMGVAAKEAEQLVDQARVLGEVMRRSGAS
jgi:hypothetical protein